VFFALMAPFAVFEPSTAFTGRVVFQFICLMYVLFLIKCLFRELTPVKWLFLSLLIMSSSFVYYHFYDSQISLFLVALVLSAYALIDTKYRHAADYLVRLVRLLKIYPFIFLPWFIWQKFQNKKRISYYDLLGIAAVSILIITVTGWRSWFTFIDRSLRGSVGESFGIYYNYSLPSFIVNYIYVFWGYFPSGIKGTVIVYGGVLIGFGVLLFSYIFYWRYSKSKAVGFAFLTVDMLLTFPRVLSHYHVF
jgi:hypothetical protein